MMLWVLVVIGVLGLPAATAAVLGRTRVVAAFAVAWGAWVVVAVVLAANDVFRQDVSSVVPWIGVAVVVPFLAVVAATRIPAVARVLDDNAQRLALPQTLRVVGVVFLIAMVMGKLPAVFALPAGLGDMAVGIAAPFVARRANQTAFHLLGLLDLVVAVSIGFLAGLGPTRVFDVSPSTLDISLLPLVLVPVAAVPLAAALHVAALTRSRSLVPSAA